MEKKNPGVQLWLVKLSAAFSPQGWRGTGPISTESLKQESLSILWFYFLHPTTPNHRRLCICSCFPFQKNANIGPKPRQQLDQRLQKMLMTTVFYLYRFHGALTSSVFSHTTEGEVHHDWGKKKKMKMQLVVFDFTPHEAGSTCGDEADGRGETTRGVVLKLKSCSGIMSRVIPGSVKNFNPSASGICVSRSLDLTRFVG